MWRSKKKRLWVHFCVSNRHLLHPTMLRLWAEKCNSSSFALCSSLRSLYCLSLLIAHIYLRQLQWWAKGVSRVGIHMLCASPVSSLECIAQLSSKKKKNLSLVTTAISNLPGSSDTSWDPGKHSKERNLFKDLINCKCASKRSCHNLPTLIKNPSHPRMHGHTQ